MMVDYDFLFKFVLVGNSSVGKSSLIQRFANGNFTDNYVCTLGVDFSFKTFVVENKNVKLQIWDTAGQEKFRTITSAYYKGANVIIIVYDVSNRESFDQLDYWLDELNKYASEDVTKVLIGNKKDLQSLVSIDEAQSYADKNNLMFFETSAKTNQLVENSFYKVVQALIKKYYIQNPSKKITLNSQNKIFLKKSCC